MLAEAHFLSLRHPATPVPLWGTQSTPPLPLKHRASLPNAEAGLSRTRRTTFPGSAVSLAVRSEPPPCSSLSTLSCSVILCLSVTFRKQLVSSDITAPRWGPSGQLESVVWEHHTHPLATAGSRCQSRAPAGSRAPPPLLQPRALGRAPGVGVPTAPPRLTSPPCSRAPALRACWLRLTPAVYPAGSEAPSAMPILLPAASQHPDPCPAWRLDRPEPQPADVCRSSSRARHPRVGREGGTGTCARAEATPPAAARAA